MVPFLKRITGLLLILPVILMLAIYVIGCVPVAFLAWVFTGRTRTLESMLDKHFPPLTWMDYIVFTLWGL